MKDESQKYISIIFKEWLPLYDSLTPEVRAVLKNIAGQQAEALATRFYDFIFQDPDIARHLSYDVVQERLSSSLAGWVKDILMCDKENLQALAERQDLIGKIKECGDAYTNKHKFEHSGPNGGAIQTITMSKEEYKSARQEMMEDDDC